jgi:pilus assembly protein CpaC
MRAPIVPNTITNQPVVTLFVAALVAALAAAGHAQAADKASSSADKGSPAARATALKPCTAVVMDKPSAVSLGKTTVLRLDSPVVRMVIGGRSNSRAMRPTDAGKAAAPGSAAAVPPPAPQMVEDSISDVDITLLSPTELFILGKKAGSMNVVLQGADGSCHVKDIIVTLDPETLRAKLLEVMPEETGITVRGAENTLVLTGRVSDALRLDDVMHIATSYGDGKRVVNLLRINTPQQVMLEVKIAEVSKTLLDRFGLDFTRLSTSADGMTSRIASGIIGGGPAVFGQFNPNTGSATITGSAAGQVSGGNTVASGVLNAATRGASLFGIDAQKKDGLVRVLAEPNIMAISGQQASFLSGGKIFIPVAQSNSLGAPTITLEEKEFGVGLKFMPTVLDGTRINLKLVSEVSELSQTGSPFTTVGGVTSVLPSLTTRRVDTTVQLNDGQSFAVAGLIRNNVTETISRFPGAGEVPIVGALFRSTEFLNDQTELIFVITPRLVKPVNDAIALPTDNHLIPNRADVLFMGKAEGTSPARGVSAQGQASGPAPAPLQGPQPGTALTPAAALAPGPKPASPPEGASIPVTTSGAADPNATAEVIALPVPQPK